MNSKEDSIDDSFDVDVVGFTDLHDYKSEGELFDFDSSADYGLFGEKEVYTFGTSSKSLGNYEKHKNVMVPCKKKRRSKDWNDAEKGLYLTGLEMFGQNCKKISKFIATKTPYQVKIYHQLCSDTENVVQDVEPLLNDSSIYLPVIPEENNICLGLIPAENDIDFVNTKFISSDRPSSSNVALSLVNNLVLNVSETTEEASQSRSITKQNCGDELFVSPLHDWSLGSQVSVIDEISSFNSQEEQNYYQSNVIVSPSKNNFKLPSNKNKNHSKPTKKGKKVVGYKKGNIKVSSAEKVFDGEVIHLDKGNDIDCDVDIVGSDDEDENQNSFEGCHDEVCTGKEHNRNVALYETNLFKIEPLLESLTPSERVFCENQLGVEKVDCYISGKQYIAKLWNESTSHITLSQVLIDSEHCNISNKDMSKIYYFLEKQGFINNSKSEENVRSKRCSKNIDRVKKKFSSKMYKQLGGGVTLSHDASGIVTNAVHVPENHLNMGPSCKKTKTTSNGIELQKCLKYQQDRKAPFITIIYPSAIILLDIHAHSSYSEVMGLLGGYLDVDDAILYITIVVATKAISSTIDGDMCPFDQKEAVQRIQEAGSEVVGWYHSHPTFLPNPSKRDLETQAQLQGYFQKQNYYFIGLIISPFCSSVFSGASLIRCLILDEQIVGSHTLSPFSLPWKVCDEFDINYDDIESVVIQLLVKIDSHPSSIKWSKEYLSGVSYANKLCQSLLTHIPDNLKSTINLVKNTLCCNL